VIRSERGVSTVIDVSLALLLISASVVLIGLHLNDTDESVDVQGSERTAETLAGTTVTVEYDTSVVASSDNFEESESATPEMYRRTTYGSASGLIADAAVTSAEHSDEQILGYADEYEDSVEAAVVSSMVGSNHEFYAVARWEPYEGSMMSSNVTVGERPPRTEDVTVTTITTESGMPAVDATNLSRWVSDAGTHEIAIERTAMATAGMTIQGFFPPEKSQYALERHGISRELKAYHYRQMSNALAANGDFDEKRTLDPDNRANHLRRKAPSGESPKDFPSARKANKNLGKGLSSDFKGDIEDGTLGEEIVAIREEYSDPDEEQEKLEELFEESVSVGEVQITVQTWES